MTVTALAGDKRIADRLWRKVRVQPDGCWMWTGNTAPNGYGSISVGHSARRIAHRMFYEALIGPAGALLDHVCHTLDPTCPGGFSCPHRRCVNPAHLEPVTHRENLLRSPHTQTSRNAAKTECVNGHPFDETNTYIRQNVRCCRECTRERSRQQRRDRAAVGLSSKGAPYVRGPYQKRGQP